MVAFVVLWWARSRAGPTGNQTATNQVRRSAVEGRDDRHPPRVRMKGSAMPTDYMVAGAPTHTDAPRTPDAHFVREVQKGRGGKKSISPKKLRNSGSSTANVATAPAAQMLRDDVDYFRSESLEDIEQLFVR